MNLGTNGIIRRTLDSLPDNYVSLAQLKEKWMQKKQEQREKEEQEQIIRKQEVEERNRKLEEEQRKKRLGKDVQGSKSRYNQAKEDNSRKNPSSHHWKRRNVSGTTFRVVRSPCPEPVLEQVPTMAVKMHLKFASGLIEDNELKPGQPNQRKGKEICTEHRWSENPTLEDHRKGNIKQSPAKSKVHKMFASIVPETFEDGRESNVKLEIVGNSNARKASISKPVLEQVAMGVKEVFNISPGLVENGEATFFQPNQRKEKEIYAETRRNGNPVLEYRCKGNQKQSQRECKGDKTTASVTPETFKNGSESVKHEICLNSNARNADMEVKDILKISTLKIGHPKQWKEKIYTEKQKNLNPKSEDGIKRNQNQSQAEGQGAKTIASVASGTFKNEREGVEREIGRYSNVTTVDNPPPETIAHRFENLSMKDNASRFRSKHKKPKCKLVWVRKEDVSSNDDLNGAQSSGNRKIYGE